MYRIAHQSLVDYVRGNATTMLIAGNESKTAAQVASAILAEYDRLLDAGLRPGAHSYLWRHAWRHLAEAGSSGIAGLRHLVERDREAFLPDLASGLELAAGKSLAAGEIAHALELIEEAIGIRRQLGDKLTLAMALFNLTFVQTSAGEGAKADKTAAEAAKLARAAGDRPEGRAVLGAALVARSHSLLLNSYFKSALVLAQEAVELIEVGDAGDLNAKAAAYSVKGRAAFLMKDFETAATACQRAVDLADEQRNSDVARAIRVEALAVLANIEVLNSTSSAPDASGRYSSTVMPAARRMLSVYEEQEGGEGNLGDIALSSGIQAYVRGCVVDRLRGVEASDVGDLRPIVKQAIDLVRPFAGQVLAATLTFAEGAALFLKLDPGGAASDCAYAEERLRPIADSNDFAALTLGLLLDATNDLLMPQLLQGSGDASAIVARQREAVALLRRSGFWSTRIALAGALSKLATLLVLPAIGDAEQGNAVRSEAIEEWRALVGKVPGASIQFVALLSDQAGNLLATRAGEAIDLAREAVSAAESLPQPQCAGLSGTAETNLAGAILVNDSMGGPPKQGSPPKVRELLQGAIKRLQPLAPHPIFSGTLAVAYMNLAQTELLDRRYSEALAHAERAVELLDSPDILPIFSVNRPKALLNLGRAQRESGQVELGTKTLRREIDRLRAMAEVSKDGVVELAATLNFAAPDFWDDVIEGFTDRPDLQRALNIGRWRSPSDIAATVNALLDAFNTSPATEHRVLRQAARAQRARATEEFDAAWREKVGEIPRWLKLDLGHEWLVIAWWNTQDWKLSRDYLKSHPALLTVLDEFALAGANDDVVNGHRALLNDSREIGVDAAFAPLLEDLEIRQWMQSEDLERYLAEHPELLRPEIATTLRKRAKGDVASAVFASILDLAHRGESELAFQAAEESGSMHDQLRAAWRAADISRLASLATIVQACTEDGWTRRVSTLALAIARTLEHSDEPPESLIAPALEGSSESDRKELVAIVGDAIQHRPALASEFVRLISAINDVGRISGTEDGRTDATE